MKYATTLLVPLLLFACTSKTPVEYVLDEKDLVPEGIAYSEKKDAFYLTSVAKSKIDLIVRYTVRCYQKNVVLISIYLKA